MMQQVAELPVQLNSFFPYKNQVSSDFLKASKEGNTALLQFIKNNLNDLADLPPNEASLKAQERAAIPKRVCFPRLPF